MKKLLLGVIIVLIGIFAYVHISGTELLLEAESYGMESDIGLIFSISERTEAKRIIEEASVNNYAIAKGLIDEMIGKGYNITKLPLILYSGVTSGELELVIKAHNEFITAFPK